MKLPVSSFKVLRMIILGYLHQGGADRKPAPLKAVQKSTGVAMTKISSNNGALADLGLIEKEGNAGYRLTEHGLEVARALEFEEPELTKRALRSLLQGNDTISQALNLLRVRGGLDADALAKHLMMSSGEAKATAAAQTGARALIDMMLEAGLVEQDGDFVAALSTRPGPARSDGAQHEDGEQPEEPMSVERPQPLQNSTAVAVPLQEGVIGISVEISLTGDDLADTGRSQRILEALRRLAELGNE